jgi:dihydrofolate reductase
MMGSGTIVPQLADAGQADEFHLAVSPTVLGRGRSMFATQEPRFGPRRFSTREFASEKRR